MHASSPLALLFVAALVPAQGRIFIAGMPSNLSLYLSSTPTVLDPAASDAFFALMPFTYGQTSFPFAVFDADLTMNSLYGSGNYLRCTMFASHWAYLTNDACAHQPALGAAAPQSLLTTDYDWGFYGGVPGTPNQPWPGATMFTGGSYPAASYCQGLPTGFSPARWQLRTRGWFTNDAWNACPIGTPFPNFSGWLLVRFTFSFV
jgi:hypothetical protein